MSDLYAFLGAIPPRRERIEVDTPAGPQQTADGPEQWLRDAADTLQARIAEDQLLDLDEMRDLMMGLRIVTQQIWPTSVTPTASVVKFETWRR